MRFDLAITGNNWAEIKTAIEKIISDYMDSNCGGWSGPCHYQYHFTDTSDVFISTDDMECIGVEKFDKELAKIVHQTKRFERRLISGQEGNECK
jgi:hypothetical protein